MGETSNCLPLFIIANLGIHYSYAYDSILFIILLIHYCIVTLFVYIFEILSLCIVVIDLIMTWLTMVVYIPDTFIFTLSIYV